METIVVKSEQGIDFINITEKIQNALGKYNIKDGFCKIFIPHTTAGIYLIENEEGAKLDLKRAFGKLAPTNEIYCHNQKAWACDENGRAHVLATVACRQDMSLFIKNGELVLGKYQTIFLVDFDERSRERKIMLMLAKAENL